MPTRFRKTIQIMPGVKVNLSKGGMSFSLGRKGFTVNIGKHGVRRTVSIPGTGVSNTEYITKKDADEDDNKEKSDKKEEEGGLLDGVGALGTMAAVGALMEGEKEKEKEKEEEKREKRARRKTTHRKSTRTTRAERAERVEEEGSYLALRGVFVFAALVIAVYLGTIVYSRLPPTWLTDLGHFLVQWAVQFGH